MQRKSVSRSILALISSNLSGAIQRCAWKTLWAAMLALIRPDIVTSTQPAGILPPPQWQFCASIPISNAASKLRWLSRVIERPTTPRHAVQRRQQVSWPAGSRICFSRSVSASACTVMPCHGNQGISSPACLATQCSIGTTPCRCGAPAHFVLFLCQLCVSQKQTTCLTQVKETAVSCLTEVQGWNWHRLRPSSHLASRPTSDR